MRTYRQRKDTKRHAHTPKNKSKLRWQNLIDIDGLNSFFLHLCLPVCFECSHFFFLESFLFTGSFVGFQGREL